MNEDESSISHGRSYQDIGEYWDTHDLGEAWEQTRPADFVVSGRGRMSYYPVEGTLSRKLQAFARQRGESAEALVNRWLQEKITQEAA